MPFSVPWSDSTPDGNEDASLGDDRIREFKVQVRERLSVDHHFPITDADSTGYHEKVTLRESLSDPAQVSNALILYAKQAGGARELFTRHESAIMQQITKNGKIWLPSLVMDLQSRGDLAYFDGSIWNRLVMGFAGQLLRVNSGRSDLEYFTAISVAASQAEMEAATDDTVIVTPAKVNFNPGVAKAYCVFDGTTPGTNAPIAGYNVPTVQRVSTGKYTMIFTVPFSTAFYAVSPMANDVNNVQPLFRIVGTPSASSITIEVINAGGLVQDQTYVSFVFHGDQ